MSDLSQASPTADAVRPNAHPADILAGQTYAVWWPFRRDTYLRLDENGGTETPTWVPGWSVELVGSPEDPGADYAWDGAGEMRLRIVSLHRPGPGYPERAFYVRQWRDPDGRVFGKTNLRMTSTRALRKWLAGSRTDHLFYDLKGALDRSRAEFVRLLRENTAANIQDGAVEAPYPRTDDGPASGTNQKGQAQ